MPKLKTKLAGFILGLIFSGAALAADPVAVNPAHPDRYTVVAGDTLWDIARKYGVSTSDIKSWNGINRAKNLRPGDKLKIYVKRDVAKEA